MHTLDLDTIIDRRGTGCLKYDFAVQRGKPADVLPFWVADMDFRVAEPISFYTDSHETALRVLKSVRLIRFAESLGGVESLITYPATQTHADLTEEERESRGITACLLRLSVGIEDVNDLIADLSQALGE